MSYKNIARNGDRYYLYERESFWDPKRRRTRQRTVRYLGRCDKNGKLIQAVKPRVERVYSATPAGPTSCFYAAAKDLSIVERARAVLKVDLPVAQGFLALALNQVVYRLPVSTRLSSWVQDSLLPQWEKWDVSNLSRRGFEGTLDALCSYTQGMRKLQAGLELQDELTRAWRGETREPAGFYYDFDTTKVRYYGTTQPYAEVGHASDRSIRRVVAFGLVTSRVHHHPVQLRPIMGSRSDFLSVDETVGRLEGADVKGVTLVMDRGMVSAENIARVRKAGYHQIGMVRDGGDDWWEALGHWDEEALQRPENLVVRPSGERLYAQAWTGRLLGQRQLRLALVVDPEEKELERLGRDEKVRELLGAPEKARVRELRVELGVQDPCRKKNGHYTPGLLVKSRGRRGFQVDREKVKEETLRDGRHLLFSTDVDLSAEEMCRAYFERDAIEKSFRTAKGPLSLAPIRYRSETRLEAYATVLYTGLLLWSWEERKLRRKYPRRTLEDALWALRDVSVVKIGSGKTVREFTTKLNGEQEDLLALLGGDTYLPAT
jgi:hypothetical protein